VWTPGTEKTRQAREAKGQGVEDLLNKFAGRMPLGRYGAPDDIAKVVLFFASEASDYVTGAMLLVDGGYLLT
jgi:NAD(P)-dependent dehydrogenase (short-subunit alcohol dehydrogenase family)